ncbi:LysR family transcriptional regulator [Lacticaseibacillus brantae]|uniref:LysR family transcriptional regulator n=1 Tax=Lacticaseibacillus brantae DSM 23927 TaxID=1423727 RepID=A0A0R2B1M6_9LACO|nr:LysR family transcriptional regulator [Lacticaseibacillus brantae]KRM72970.1 LysR family transcriptional regulator [Lacticaseibacillus brantae DSM 23927]
MKFSTLEYFVAVATEKSFTKAAAKLYLSQPTLSRHIGELEAEVGVRLFNRQPHNLELTSAGTKFLTEATIVLDQMDRLEHLFDNSGEVESAGIIKIGYLPGFNLSKMYQGLNDFKRHYPKVQYLLTQVAPADLVAGLESGEFDLIFNLATYLAPLNNIVQTNFLANHLQLAMPIGHKLGQSNEVSFNELRNETFILLERQQSPVIVDYVVSQALKNGFNLKANTYVKNLDEGLTMAALGKGIAFLYSGMNDGTLESRYQIKIVDLMSTDNDQDIVCAMTTDNSNPQVRRLFAQFQQE